MNAPTVTSQAGNCITVLTSINKTTYQPIPVGKRFQLLDGKVEPVTTVDSICTAQTVLCDSLESLQTIITNLTESQFILHGQMQGTAPGDGYVVYSEKDLKAQLQLPHTAQRPIGLQLASDGITKIAGRFLQNYTPSRIVLFDRDRDPDMPESMQDADDESWWKRMIGEFPFLDGVARLSMPSSKSRVMFDNHTQAIDAVSTHTYIMLDDADDYVRFTAGIKKLAKTSSAIGYTKDVKVNYKDGRTTTRHDKKTIFDPAVFTVSQPDFAGAPSVEGAGMYIAPPSLTLHPGKTLNSLVVTLPELGVNGGGGSDVDREGGLELDMLVDSKEFGWISIEDAGNKIRDGLALDNKVRCQSLFRDDSTSMNAAVRLTTDGKPCLYEHGIPATFYLDVTADVFGPPDPQTPEQEAQYATEKAAYEAQEAQATADASVAQDLKQQAVSEAMGLAGALTNDPGDVDQWDHLADLVCGMDEGNKQAVIAAVKAGGAKGIGDFKNLIKTAMGRYRESGEAERVAQQAMAVQASQVTYGAYLPSVAGNPFDFYPDALFGEEGEPLEILQTSANWEKLTGALGVGLWFNKMTRRVEVQDNGRYGLDVGDTENNFTALFDAGLRNGLPEARAGARLVHNAHQHKYHPLEAFLHGVTWDGIDRIKQVAETAITDDPGHFEMILTPWLISVVAAVYGFKGVPARGVLTLAGDQNIGKSGWLEAIAPPGMFMGGASLHLGGHNDKDSIATATQRLVVELAELDSIFKRSDISALKAFLNKIEDTYRSPYERFDRTTDRQTVYSASVNDGSFLQDRTGNTRYWVAKILGFNFDGENGINKIDRQQFWAQVKVLYDKGDRWTLTKEEMATSEVKNETFRDKPPIEVALEDAFQWDHEVYVEWKKQGSYGSVHLLPDAERLLLQGMTSTKIAERLGFELQYKSNSRIQKDLNHALVRLTGMKPRCWVRYQECDPRYKGWILPA